MARLWASMLLGALCVGAAPARANDLAESVAPLPIRSVSADTRPRFSLRRLLRDIVFGVTWDRARLPLNVSLRGNSESAQSIRLTLSRRNFSGVTYRLRF